MPEETLNVSSFLRAVDLGSVENLLVSQKRAKVEEGRLSINLGKILVKAEIPKGKEPSLDVMTGGLERMFLSTLRKKGPDWVKDSSVKWQARKDLEIPPELVSWLEQLEAQWRPYGGIDFSTAVGYPESTASGKIGYILLKIEPADLFKAIQCGVIGQASIRETVDPELAELFKAAGMSPSAPDWLERLLPQMMQGYPAVNEACRRILEVPGNPNQIKASHRVAMKTLLGVDPDAPFKPAEYVAGRLHNIFN